MKRENLAQENDFFSKGKISRILPPRRRRRSRRL